MMKFLKLALFFLATGQVINPGGGGGGSGTVNNCGQNLQMAYYASNGTAVSCTPELFFASNGVSGANYLGILAQGVSNAAIPSYFMNALGQQTWMSQGATFDGTNLIRTTGRPVGRVILYYNGDSTSTVFSVDLNATNGTIGNPVTLITPLSCITTGCTVASVVTAAARKGTFVCTNAGTITILNANETVTSDVIISMNTAGGTITTPPAMKTVTAGTGFTVLCGATDTSTYNYSILN